MSPSILLINLSLGPTLIPAYVFFLAITAIIFIKADVIKKTKRGRTGFLLILPRKNARKKNPPFPRPC